MEDFNLVEDIKQGLTEAIAHAKGELPDSDFRIHKVEVKDLDVSAIRKRTGLSQSQFAQNIGVSKHTLIGWEHKRRKPNGASKVLLNLINKKPDIVQEFLTL